MFSELDTKGPKFRKGSIEVVCGSMFSGKTEELIRRMKRAKFAKLKVEIFKPAIDVRYSDAEVVSHDRNAIQSTPVDSSQNILLMASDVDVVGIDEAQFFDMGIVDVCNELARRGVRVICAGLDMDFKGVPFGPMPALMAIADHNISLSHSSIFFDFIDMNGRENCFCFLVTEVLRMHVCRVF